MPFTSQVEDYRVVGYKMLNKIPSTRDLRPTNDELSYHEGILGLKL